MRKKVVRQSTRVAPPVTPPARRVNAKGLKPAKPRKPLAPSAAPTTKEAEIGLPTDLHRALATGPEARAAWKTLTFIARRDFMSWIDSAKQAETRARRIERACENLASGKRRPCCYAVVPMDFYKALWAVPTAKARWSDLTPTERRDFTDWIDSNKEREARKGRIEQACALLAAGKRHP